MLKLEEVVIDEFFANQRMPHGVRIRHIATGIQIEGNCASEASKGQLIDTLMTKLSQFVPATSQEEHGRPTADNTDLQRQVWELQAQLAALTGKQVTPKKRGRPAKAKTVEVLSPAGYSVLDPSKVQPPAATFVQETRSFKPPQTVAVSHVKDIAA